MCPEVLNGTIPLVNTTTNFTYTVQTTAFAATFLSDTESALLSQVAERVLQCDPRTATAGRRLQQSDVPIYGVGYPPDSPVSTINSCAVTAPSAQSCWTVDSQMTIITEAGRQNEAQDRVLGTIEGEFNSTGVVTQSIPDLVQVDFAASEPTNPAPGPDGESTSNRLLPLAATISISLAASAVCVLGAFLLLKRRKRRQKAKSTMDDRVLGSRVHPENVGLIQDGIDEYLSKQATSTSTGLQGAIDGTLDPLLDEERGDGPAPNGNQGGDGNDNRSLLEDRSYGDEGDKANDEDESVADLISIHAGDEGLSGRIEFNKQQSLLSEITEPQEIKALVSTSKDDEVSYIGLAAIGVLGSSSGSVAISDSDTATNDYGDDGPSVIGLAALGVDNESVSSRSVGKCCSTNSRNSTFEPAPITPPNPNLSTPQSTSSSSTTFSQPKALGDEFSTNDDPKQAGLTSLSGEDTSMHGSVPASSFGSASSALSSVRSPAESQEKVSLPEDDPSNISGEVEEVDLYSAPEASILSSREGGSSLYSRQESDLYSQDKSFYSEESGMKDRDSVHSEGRRNSARASSFRSSYTSEHSGYSHSDASNIVDNERFEDGSTGSPVDITNHEEYLDGRFPREDEFYDNQNLGSLFTLSEESPYNTEEDRISISRPSVDDDDGGGAVPEHHEIGVVHTPHADDKVSSSRDISSHGSSDSPSTGPSVLTTDDNPRYPIGDSTSQNGAHYDATNDNDVGASQVDSDSASRSSFPRSDLSDGRHADRDVGNNGDDDDGGDGNYVTEYDGDVHTDHLEYEEDSRSYASDDAQFAFTPVGGDADRWNVFPSEHNREDVRDDNGSNSGHGSMTDDRYDQTPLQRWKEDTQLVAEEGQPAKVDEPKQDFTVGATAIGTGHSEHGFQEQDNADDWSLEMSVSDTSDHTEFEFDGASVVPAETGASLTAAQYVDDNEQCSAHESVSATETAYEGPVASEGFRAVDDESALDDLDRDDKRSAGMHDGDLFIEEPSPVSRMDDHPAVMDSEGQDSIEDIDEPERPNTKIAESREVVSSPEGTIAEKANDTDAPHPDGIVDDGRYDDDDDDHHHDNFAGNRDGDVEEDSGNEYIDRSLMITTADGRDNGNEEIDDVDRESFSSKGNFVEEQSLSVHDNDSQLYGHARESALAYEIQEDLSVGESQRSSNTNNNEQVSFDLYDDPETDQHSAKSSIVSSQESFAVETTSHQDSSQSIEYPEEERVGEGDQTRHGDPTSFDDTAGNQYGDLAESYNSSFDAIVDRKDDRSILYVEENNTSLPMDEALDDRSEASSDLPFQQPPLSDAERSESDFSGSRLSEKDDDSEVDETIPPDQVAGVPTQDCSGHDRSIRSEDGSILSTYDAQFDEDHLYEDGNQSILSEGQYGPQQHDEPNDIYPQPHSSPGHSTRGSSASSSALSAAVAMTAASPPSSPVVPADELENSDRSLYSRGRLSDAIYSRDDPRDHAGSVIGSDFDGSQESGLDNQESTSVSSILTGHNDIHDHTEPVEDIRVETESEMVATTTSDADNAFNSEEVGIETSDSVDEEQNPTEPVVVLTMTVKQNEAVTEQDVKAGAHLERETGIPAGEQSMVPPNTEPTASVLAVSTTTPTAELDGHLDSSKTGIEIHVVTPDTGSGAALPIRTTTDTAVTGISDSGHRSVVETKEPRASSPSTISPAEELIAASADGLNYAATDDNDDDNNNNNNNSNTEVNLDVDEGLDAESAVEHDEPDDSHTAEHPDDSSSSLDEPRDMVEGIDFGDRAKAQDQFEPSQRNVRAVQLDLDGPNDPGDSDDHHESFDMPLAQSEELQTSWGHRSTDSSMSGAAYSLEMPSQNGSAYNFDNDIDDDTDDYSDPFSDDDYSDGYNDGYGDDDDFESSLWSQELTRDVADLEESIHPRDIRDGLSSVQEMDESCSSSSSNSMISLQ